MFEWFFNLFRKEKPKQVQVVTSDTIAIQTGSHLVINVPDLYFSAQTVEAPAKTPNAETRQAMEDSVNGNNVARFESVDEMFEELDTPTPPNSAFAMRASRTTNSPFSARRSSAKMNSAQADSSSE